MDTETVRTGSEVQSRMMEDLKNRSSVLIAKREKNTKRHKMLIFDEPKEYKKRRKIPFLSRTDMIKSKRWV